MKIDKLPEAALLEKDLMHLKNDAARVKLWSDGRCYIEGQPMTIHELFRPAVKSILLSGIAADMKSVTDQLRAIGVEPNGGES